MIFTLVKRVICSKTYNRVLNKLRTVNRMSSTKGSESSLVGVCQMTSTNDKEKNFATCRSLIEKAKEKGAKMIFLPEAFDYVAESKEQSVEMSESLNGETIKKYQALAKSLDVWLSLGGFHQKVPEMNNKKILNCHVILDNNGDVLSVYSKVHLFDVDLPSGQRLRESDFCTPGNRLLAPLETPVGRVGLGVCYDLRFPEMSTLLCQWGAQILTYPSAFTKATGEAHWEILLRSRAIENQCYVIAAAQTGQHNSKRISYGHSMVVDPWGNIVASCKEETDQVIVAPINLQHLNDVRQKMPVWNHRRHDVYLLTSEETSLKYLSISNEDRFAFGEFTIPGNHVFYRTPFSFAFVNLKPVLPGHVLVCPIRPIVRFGQLSPQEMADLFETVKRVDVALAEEFQTTAATIATQDGKAAGQSVEHVHIHIVPRKAADLANNDDIYPMIERMDLFDRKPREFGEMEEEAKRLRRRFINSAANL